MQLDDIQFENRKRDLTTVIDAIVVSLGAEPNNTVQELERLRLAVTSLADSGCLSALGQEVFAVINNDPSALTFLGHHLDNQIAAIEQRFKCPSE